VFGCGAPPGGHGGHVQAGVGGGPVEVVGGGAQEGGDQAADHGRPPSRVSAARTAGEVFDETPWRCGGP
jgi:hypothetical protein